MLQGGKNTIDKGTEQELRRRVRDDLSIVLGRDSAAFGESYPLYEKLISGKVYHGILEKKLHRDGTDDDACADGTDRVD